MDEAAEILKEYEEDQSVHKEECSMWKGISELLIVEFTKAIRLLK